MSEKRYIPQNSFLECDKGSIPTQLKVTHHNNTKIYGEHLASEADMIPNENIIPFGACKVTGSTCVPDPIYWDKCNENAKVNGYKLVFEDSCLLCKQGGKVSVSFDTPMAIMQMMADELGGAEHWIMGLAIGNENGQLLIDKFKVYSQQAANAKPNLTSTNTAIRQAAKESFGENLSKLDLQAKGYQINGTPHGRPFEQGIDVVAKDPKSGMDILDETKFKSGNGKPYTNSKPTSSGRQGSTKWFKDRLNGRVSDVDAARISDKLDINSSQLQKTISKVEPNGNITRYQLNANGTTGNPVNVGTANVIKGNSKAANFINNVGRTVQANKGVASANQWLTRNAHTISRVGKVAGRGAVVVGIIFEGYNVYTAYQEEGEVGDKTKEAIGSASGALAGGLIGAKIGASVGVVVGGLVGGAIGAFAGSEFGKAIGNGRLKKEIASWF
ncbi:MAG: PAAR-like protein [Flavobacteriales bacterium]